LRPAGHGQFWRWHIRLLFPGNVNGRLGHAKDLLSSDNTQPASTAAAETTSNQRPPI
jgi:hypothetical protein